MILVPNFTQSFHFFIILFRTKSQALSKVKNNFFVDKFNRRIL